MSNARLTSLLEAYVDGRLAPEDAAELERLLLASEAARRQFWEETALHGLTLEAAQLKWSAQPALAPRPRLGIGEILSGLLWPRWRWAWAGGLAATALVVIGAWLWSPRREEAPAAVTRLAIVRGQAVVSRAGGESRASEGFELRPGDAIRVGDGASAAVRFADETRLELSARTELQLGEGEARELQLVAGRLVARVAKQPADRPLTIRTALATARVVGTEFTLDAGARATRIEVSEGLVKMAHAGVDSAVEVAGGEFAVAVPRAELIAGLLPAKEREEAAGGDDFEARPFAKDGPWKRPVGSGAAYAEVQSPALDLAGHGASVRPASHMRPFFVAKPGDSPRRIVARYGGEELATVPAPNEALRGGEMPICTLLDPARAVAWELRSARPAGDAVEAMLCVPIQLRGPGVGGNLFSGLPAIAGIIRAGELERGIGHALSVSVLQSALNRRGPTGGPFVPPARHMPIEEKKLASMGEAGNLHYGTRLALPRDLDLKTLGVGNSGPVFEIARALRDYGAYVTHSFPAAPAGNDWKQAHIQFIADLPMETDWPKLDADVSRIARHLKVVSNNGSR